MSSTGKFIKGIAIGLIAGTAIGVAVMPKSKQCKRMTGRFLRAAGDIVDNISGFWS
jgi:gas vesicle protein